MNRESAFERRRAPRLAPKGTVVFPSLDAPVHARIVDLGLGGARVRALDPPPTTLVSTRVELAVRLDGRSAEWIELGGTVVRIGPDHDLALAFEHVPAAYEQLVRDELRATNALGDITRVVLVDRTPERRGVLAAAFREAGCDVVATSTPLEAIVRMGEARYEPQLIAITDTFPDWVAEELRAFLHAEHPRARMVVVGASVLAPSASGSDWLSSADPRGDLVARIRRLLGTPSPP